MEKVLAQDLMDIIDLTDWIQANGWKKDIKKDFRTRGFSKNNKAILLTFNTLQIIRYEKENENYTELRASIFKNSIDNDFTDEFQNWIQE